LKRVELCFAEVAIRLQKIPICCDSTWGFNQFWQNLCFYYRNSAEFFDFGIAVVMQA
jgi:hypothetical protein